jgi:hypothetical protein
LSKSRKNGAIQCSAGAVAVRGIERGDGGEEERERERPSLEAGGQGLSERESSEGVEQE